MFKFQEKLIAVLVSTASVLSINLMAIQPATACTRAVYTSPDGQFVITGRNMDWFESLDASLWILPRGLKRNGAAGQNSLEWISKYGSVVVTGFDKAVADGMNEQGLAVNALYLGETKFGQRDINNPGLSWAGYVQYLLDNFASVSEAVQAMKDSRIEVVSSPIPGADPKPPTLHFSLSDSTGDSAIFEYLNGKLVIHHGKQYKVMTNSPIYSQQLALNTYWEIVGGENMLPGTVRASDRYVRASYYVDQIPTPDNNIKAVTDVMAVMRNTAQPQGKVDAKVPNISPTIWQSIADNTSKTYYYQQSNLPSSVWVEFKELDFSNGAKVMKVTLQDNYKLVGNIKDAFSEAKLFEFTGPMDKSQNVNVNH
ncbi:linear amide C-N hydrolase [Legionella yabuuchiae]|uniref:linear amide C-N hydrolase n=1 Tax=Legionella yabuuchiae TaxID=376727 RepID=UPI001A945CAB|nr:linear amide C-N hydrolase [Legionella yabuuchiae]